MPNCWVIGDAAVDLLPDGDHYIKCPGGTGANIAVALARLGIDNYFVSKLGDDPLASFLIDTFEREKVKTEYVSRSLNCKTSLIIVSLDGDGERSFTFMVRPSADSQLASEDFPRFEEGDWVCVSAFILAREPSRTSTLNALNQAKAAGCVVCVDANMRADVWDEKSSLVPKTVEALQIADVVKVSEDEMLFLTNTHTIKEGIDAIKRWTAKIKIVTRAQKGAILLTEQAEHYIDGYRATVIDTTGAGDAFFAAFISQLIWSKNWSDDTLVTAAKFSNACGALVVQQKGAMSALPYSGAAQNFIVGKKEHV